MTVDERAGQITRAIMADLPRDRALVPEHVGPVVLKHVTAALQPTEAMKELIGYADSVNELLRPAGHVNPEHNSFCLSCEKGAYVEMLDIALAAVRNEMGLNAS